MSRSLWLLAIFLPGLNAPYLHAHASTAGIPTEIFRRASPAIVTISTVESVTDYTKDQFQKGKIASGVIVRADGHVLTNYHAVEKAVQLEVILSDNSSYSAKVIGTDPLSDLALLKLVSTSFRQFPEISIASGTALAVGQKVFTIGNPSQLARSFSAGIISGLNRTSLIGRSQFIALNLIQADAVVRPGSSGGALLNEEGHLIGLTSLRSDSFGLSVPASTIQRVLPHLFKYGKSLRPHFGIQVSDFPKPVINKNLRIDHGVIVTELDPKGLMAKAGLRRAESKKTLGFYSMPMGGDIIYCIDNAEIHTAIDLNIVLSQKIVGDTVSVHFIRNGQLKTIPVPTFTKPDEPAEKKSIVKNSTSSEST